jgi:hypothetical protein
MSVDLLDDPSADSFAAATHAAAGGVRRGVLGILVGFAFGLIARIALHAKPGQAS